MHNENLWVGSKWWKFDFHTHTPASSDYGKGPKQAEFQQITPKEWLLGYMRAGIDCVAITDHNSGAWIDRLKSALSELKAESNPEYRELYLFPGVEITVQGNIHILAIFSFEKTTSDIDTLLGAVGYRGTKGASDECTEASATNVINEILRSSGIVIPAHVDDPRGLFTEFEGLTLKQVLELKTIYGIELLDPSYTKPAVYNDMRLNWSEIVGSDSHHPTGTDGQNYPGSRFTWIKMAEPSFEGIYLALLDGALSIKRSDCITTDPNRHAQLTIESICVEKAKYIGRANPLVCNFNPWLNTIIGGRGTGKSSILEFVRSALQRGEELPPNILKEYDKYRKVSTTRDDDGLLLSDTRISIDFYKDDNKYRIRWDNDNSQGVIEEVSNTGEWIIVPGEIKSRFPIRIYSQKQIFEIAKNPYALIKIVDEAPEVNYRAWKSRWDELLSQYFSMCAQEREIRVGLNEESLYQGQLDDANKKINVFQKTGHADLLKKYQKRQQQKNAITEWEAEYEKIIYGLNALVSELTFPELDAAHFNIEIEEEKHLLENFDKMKTEFDNRKKELSSVIGNFLQIRDSWKSLKQGLKITEDIHLTETSYAELKEKLKNVGENNPSSYDQLVEQKHATENKLKDFTKKKQELTEIQVQRKSCFEDIVKHRKIISYLRNDFIQRVLTDNSYVKIDLVQFGNNSNLEIELRELIGQVEGRFDRDIGSSDSSEGLVGEFLASKKSLEERIVEIKNKLIALWEKTPVIQDFPKDKRFATHVQSLPPETIDKLICWFPDDSLNIQYSLKDHEGFKPLDQGSPGQKTAALLAFILSYGTEPLILDQPEDDLDNLIIYDLIVAQLRSIKQRRQVIIVTHNANIVVNGDSENVLVLEIKGGQTQISEHGALQSKRIRAAICDIMEGGKIAFEQRYKRIQIS